MKKLFKLFITLLIICSANANDQSLTFVMYPNKDNKLLYKEYKPLLEHLQSNLNKEVNFIVAKNYRHQIELLTLNKAHLAVMGPYNYIKSQKIDSKITYLATRQIVVEKKPLTTYKAVIVASKNSNIKTIDDLKGTNFGFTDFNSTSGYLLPNIVLKEHNILKSDFKEIYMLKKHSRVMEALTRDSIDAGATYYNNYLVYKKRYGDIYNVLYTSKAIPYDVVVASAYLKDSLTDKIQDALLTFKEKIEGKEINGFVKKDEKIYDYIKKKSQMLP